MTDGPQRIVEAKPVDLADSAYEATHVVWMRERRDAVIAILNTGAPTVTIGGQFEGAQATVYRYRPIPKPVPQLVWRPNDRRSLLTWQPATLPTVETQQALEHLCRNTPDDFIVHAGRRYRWGVPE